MVLLLLTSGLAAALPQRKFAVIAEVFSPPRCVGLDCPRWPMPQEVNVCFLADGVYYAGTYRPWEAPWVKVGGKMGELKGQLIEIEVTEKYISVLSPKLKARLRRFHKAALCDTFL
jgi:hypothetical protein